MAAKRRLDGSAIAEALRSSPHSGYSEHDLREPIAHLKVLGFKRHPLFANQFSKKGCSIVFNYPKHIWISQQDPELCQTLNAMLT